MTAMEQTANHNTDTTQLVNKRVNRLLIILILLSTGISPTSAHTTANRIKTIYYMDMS